MEVNVQISVGSVGVKTCRVTADNSKHTCCTFVVPTVCIWLRSSSKRLLLGKSVNNWCFPIMPWAAAIWSRAASCSAGFIHKQQETVKLVTLLRRSRWLLRDFQPQSNTKKTACMLFWLAACDRYIMWFHLSKKLASYKYNLNILQVCYYYTATWFGLCLSSRFNMCWLWVQNENH